MPRNRPENGTQMRIVYLCMEGSPDSVAGLRAVIDAGHRVPLVVAFIPQGRSRAPEMPWYDRPLHVLIAAVKGLRNALRGAVARLRPEPPGPVAELCRREDVELILTRDRRIAHQTEAIRNAEPDVILANAWPHWIPPSVCQLARIESINCHPSYLPEYRGFNVTWPLLIDRPESTGVTVHVIRPEFDSGPILAQRRVSLERHETVRSIRRKRANAMGPVILDALKIVGRRELYRPNPPSPYYPRCSPATVLRWRVRNRLRRMFGQPPLPFPATTEGDLFESASS